MDQNQSNSIQLYLTCFALIFLNIIPAFYFIYSIQIVKVTLMFPALFISINILLDILEEISYIKSDEDFFLCFHCCSVTVVLPFLPLLSPDLSPPTPTVSPVPLSSICDPWLAPSSPLLPHYIKNISNPFSDSLT